MKIIVCGGRNYDNQKKVFEVLDNLLPYPSFVIQGGARGADALALHWCRRRAIPCLEVNPDWSRGKQAGFIRNHQMLGYRPKKVIAFPGGNGTAHMVKIAKEAKIEVLEVEDDYKT